MSKDSDHELQQLAGHEGQHAATNAGYQQPGAGAGDGGPREPYKAGELNGLDVFSFITNKMIGTGIYTAPAMILSLAGSPQLAIALWVVGFIYTIVSMFIYLSYASILPYNTGELVYLDEITSVEETQLSIHTGIFVRVKEWFRRYLGNGLFAYTIYSFLFIGLFNSGTNCLQFARQVLIAADPSSQNPPGGAQVRFIAVVTLSCICLIHYFSASAGRMVNFWLAIFKITFLFILLFKGWDMIRQKIAIPAYLVVSTEAPSKSNVAKALLLVIFSFEGWENANFVAGEVPPGSHHVLRRGFFSAVLLNGCLYIALNATFLFGVIDYSQKQPPPGQTPGLQGTSFAPLFFGDDVSAKQCWGVLTSISALGSIISIVYTFSRVKQAIGQANIIPWSCIWKTDSPERTDNTENDLKRTPMGGIILHWIQTTTFIAITASIANEADAISLPGILQTYSHALIIIPVALSLPRLPYLAMSLRNAPAHQHTFDYWLRRIWDRTGWTILPLVILILAYCACNAFVLVDYVIPPYSGVDGWKILVAVAGTLALGAAYYFLVFAASFSESSDSSTGDASNGQREIVGGRIRYRGWSILEWADVSAVISRAEEFNEYEPKARRFGSRRDVRYELGRDAWFLYWLFGGSQLDRSPWTTVEGLWQDWWRWA